MKTYNITVNGVTYGVSVEEVSGEAAPAAPAPVAKAAPAPAAPKAVSAPASKASAGAIEHLPIAKVSNIASTVTALKKKGVWVYAAEAGGTPYYDVDFTGPAAIIFGSEGNGVSALNKQNSDVIVSIPMFGKVNSFNVSTAAAVLLAEASKQHHVGKK